MLVLVQLLSCDKENIICTVSSLWKIIMFKKILKKVKSETPSHGVDELIQLFDEIDEKQKKNSRGKRKNLERIGKMELEQQSTDSLFDFLYIDRVRVSSSQPSFTMLV